jgi:hypothetical protein
VCSEQENAYHGDSRSGVPRAGHCATAVPSLGHQVGALRGSSLYLYNALGRVVLSSLATTRPLLCALSALRGTSGGASMTTPGGAGTLLPLSQSPVLGAPASSIGSARSRLLGSGPSLFPVPMPRVLLRCGPCGGRIIPDDMGVPRRRPWSIGTGLRRLSRRHRREFRLYWVLRSSL